MVNLSVADIQRVIAEKITKGLVVPEHTDTAHFYRHTGEGGGLYASVTTKTSAMNSGEYLKMWAANMAVEQLADALSKYPEIFADANRMTLAKKSAVMAHQNYFEDAGTTGTAGHNVVEDYLNDWIATGVKPESIKSFIKPSEQDSRVFASARSAELFCNEWDVQPIASELLVASKKYKYAGTLDSLMLVTLPIGKTKSPCKLHMYLGTKSGKLVCDVCSQKAERVFCIVDWKTSNSINKEQYAMQVIAYRQAFFEMTGLKPKKMYIVRHDKAQAKYEMLEVVYSVKTLKAFLAISVVYDWKNNKEKKLLPINKRDQVSLDDL